jgi:hypothetical protein
LHWNVTCFFSKRETDIKSIWKISRYKTNLKPSVNIYYGFVLQERIFQNNIASMAKWQEVHINDSMFIEDLLKWRQWHSINIITHRNQWSYVCITFVAWLIPITCIVWWYKTLYQVEPVVWTSIIMSRDSDELWCD